MSKKRKDKQKKRAKQKAKQNRINRNSGCQGDEMVETGEVCVPAVCELTEEEIQEFKNKVDEICEMSRMKRNERWKRFVEGEWS